MADKLWRSVEPAVPGLAGMGAVQWDRLVFVSGQLSRSHDGTLVGEGDIRAQTKQCFDNLATVLAEAGGSLGDIVKLNCYLARLEDFPGYFEVKRSLFPSQGPATTALVVSALALEGCLLEVDAIAVVP